MDGAFGIIVVVALIVGIFVWQSQGATILAHIFQRSRIREGRALAAKTLRFDVPVPGPEALAEILRCVDPHETKPALIGGVYANRRGADHLTLALGNKLDDAWRAEVVTTETAEGGCTVEFALSHFMEVNGIPSGSRELEKVHGCVARAERMLNEAAAT